jgi:hypothetical protein
MRAEKCSILFDYIHDSDSPALFKKRIQKTRRLFKMKELPTHKIHSESWEQYRKEKLLSKERRRD